MDFSYTGRSQVQSLDPGYYKLEVWGAHGGSTPGNNIAFIGGQGGYSVGYLNLTETMTVYVRVGGVGKGVNNDWAEGGYNGGGCAWGRASSPGNGGGGGTDIRINEDDIYSRVIVAGGGGGGGREDDGGFGGGLTGGGSNQVNKLHHQVEVLSFKEHILHIMEVLEGEVGTVEVLQVALKQSLKQAQPLFILVKVVEVAVMFTMNQQQKTIQVDAN
ncbi:PE-PGRS protein, putative [Trichomonas vaginalis G3]|uniref:receptor protein-tyrosine kinase n=1 Tax=Trichomonas vaginalis (strain ATCC PRA-98 / G3) TaxID=412133 RepID=A2E6K5_TRIV3|nr:protein kinase a regulatory subunit binding [Trichomonas vaginalis G3]EAY11710.1 PE-PGRS protein, putative [Trichomonas vaginalis G3]KAI5488850.1 protein kinase a regulatory subunit binding [Trichomonas vaginalis G3]|eukprot:XP_001323933.1 PE-PGRS protein [Trichomonas vaginalis G3]